MSLSTMLLLGMKRGRTGGENLDVANPRVTHHIFKEQSGGKPDNFLKIVIL